MVAVVLGFRDADSVGNTYGLAVISVMFVTTCLMFLIITTIWEKNVPVALIFVVMLGSIELLYLSACLAKVHRGGRVPLVSSLVILCLMSIWKYGTIEKLSFEQQNKVGLDRFLTLGPGLGIQRVPAIGLVYSNVASGVPPMFAHFVTNFPAFHQVVIFVTLGTLLVLKVPANQRFLISQVGLRELHILRCTVRYGYKDLRDSYDFESHIIDKAVEFLQRVDRNDEMFGTPFSSLNHVIDAVAAISENGPFALGRRRSMKSRKLEEVEKLTEARQIGVAYRIGNTSVVPRQGSFFLKKLAIDI